MSHSSKYRWYIVALTLVNQAVSVGIMIYSFALFVVPWLGEFEVSRSRIMLAIFSLQITIGLISPILGRWLDQYSIRMLVLIGALSTASGLFLLSQATQFWQVTIVYATFLPVGMVLCGTLSSQTLVSKWFSTNRSLAIGISSTGTSLGGFIFPLVIASLIASYDWQSALLVLSILSLVLLVPLNFIILRVEPPAISATGDQLNSIDLKVWTSREILATRTFWIPVLCLVPINAAFSGVQFHLGAYLGDLGFETQKAAQLIAVTSVSMIVGKFFFGALGDRIDHRKIYWMIALFMAAALVLFQGKPAWSMLLVAATLQGLSTGGLMPMMGAVYASRFGTLSFGRVLGFVNMFLMTGSFGSILSGWIFDTFHSYDYAFLTFLVLLLPCIIAMRWLPPPPASVPTND